MLAEIQGKLSRLGSNLTERLEDNLTGNVFGTLRYLPFSGGLGEVLVNGVHPRSAGDEIRQIKSDFWADNIVFWPYDREGEIDAMIDFPDTIIGVEVKFLSGLSSDDDITLTETDQQKEEEVRQSLNQLSRESRIIARKGQHKNKLLIFIADRKSCKEVYENVSGRGIIEQGVTFGYLSWQDFLRELKRLQLSNPFHQVMVQDVINLLIRKGFEDFTSMDVDTPVPVNGNDYFRFDGENKAELNFKTTLSISEGVYYEFR